MSREFKNQMMDIRRSRTYGSHNSSSMLKDPRETAVSLVSKSQRDSM